MPRQFTEEEAQRVFARLAELQGQGLGDDRTLSLDELREAAGAAGMDPSLVTRAVADLDAPSERRRTLLGAPVEVVASRVVSGALTDDSWAEMVTAIRSELGAVGMAGELGRTREWTHISGGNKNGVTTRLSAEPCADGTRLTISRSVRDAVMGFSIAGGVQFLMSLVFLALSVASGDLEFLIPGAIMLAFGLLFTVGTQVGTRLWAKNRAEQFDRLLDRLELVSRAAELVANGTAAAPPRLALDLDAFADDADDARTTDRRRARS